MRGVSRAEICAATRIGTRFLEALENEQWEVLPGGIFNRGFIRAVARFLGLDEDDLVAEYDLAVSEQAPAAPALVSAPSSAEVCTQTRSPVISRWLFLCSLCWEGVGSAGDGNTTVFAKRPMSPRHFGGPCAARPATATANITERSAAAQLFKRVRRRCNQYRRAGGWCIPEPAGEPRFKGSSSKLRRARKPESAYPLDGSKAFDGSIIAGQSRTFTARDDIDISANDAGALLLELNGQTLAPLGPPGQPGTATLTRSDLKPAGGAN